MRFPSLHKILFGFLMVFAGIASAQTTITSQVAQGNDDAEEQVSNGNMDLGSSDLELTSDGGTNQFVGIRFQNINIPQGTTILSAKIQFTTDETDTGSTSVTIRGDDSDNANVFSSSNYNISSRTLTSASTVWNNIPSWNTVGQSGVNQQTPDITTIVQEIVNRGGWSNGNAMAFVINGSGERTAEAYNGDSSKSPVLTIVADYTPPPLTPLPAIIPNLNRGLPFIYYMADNRSELYSVAPDPTASPLPSPNIINITYGGSPIIFTGEGGGYRSTDRQVYVFEGDTSTSSSDMYSIDPTTGIATLVKTGIVPGHVEGAEFWINNNTGEEVLVIVYNNGSSGGSDRIAAINPNADGAQPAWSLYAGFPVILSGARTRADGISWNPETAEFYIQNDNNVDYYTVDITTGVTNYAFTTSSAIDGEGITYASDGTNYIEDEDNVGLGRTIFIVDTSTGALTPAAQLGSTGDVESIMGNLGVRDDGGDAPSSYGYASHRLPVLVATPVSIYLGSVPPDSEDPFVNFSTGTSDDNSGDDEDGVTSGGSDFSGQLLSLGQVKTIDIVTNGSGVLNAWIDFNRDGDFDDPGEKIATDIVPSGGLITLNVSVPVTAVPGASYARFRYSSDTGLAPGNSTANNGEVEDYQVIIQDTISCPSGETNEEYFTYGPVYATAVIVDNSVSNQDNALGNNNATTAQFNSNGDELVLEMGENINSGDVVTVNGEDGDDFDIWVSSSATGPWTTVGTNAQLDFTFTSPINWLYIRFKRGDGTGTEDLSYVEAIKSYSNFRCVPDNDGDAIPDRTDLDDDNDGIPDADELATLVSTGQPACGGETVLDFSAAANLESGTDKQIGAVYRFANITTGTDALISITDIFNATISTIDDNATDPTYFKPMTSFNFPKAGDFGYIEYNIQFVNSGGSTPVMINKFFMNFNDIDGSAEYGEQTWADNPATYTIDNPTELTMSQEGAWVIGTSGTAGYPGAGNVNPQVNFSVNYNSKSEMSVRVGAIAFVDGANSGGRQHSIQFNCVSNYLSPETYGLDSDSDGVANHLDIDSDNDGIYDAVEAGHNLLHSNGVISGPYGLNGLADAVEASPENGTLNYIITNSDGTNPPDYLDSDSDDDGCNDANEAYANATADSDGNGYYGTGLPPAVNPDGGVIAASYQVPADSDASAIPDYQEAEAAPVINTQPTDESICEDGDTSFSVVAFNVDTYQWQFFNGSIWINLTDSGIHSGSTTNQMNITNAQNSHNGNQYRVMVSNSSRICDSVTSNSVTLTVNPKPTIIVTGSPSCNLFLTAYSLQVTVSTGTVTSTAGTVTNTSGNVWSIANVPEGTNIVLTVTDGNGCIETLPVTAPDCSCPTVNAPNSGGNKAFCTGDPVVTINATVGAAQTVDWYDAASGGSLLLAGSLSYTPSGPGTFYAEARNTITGCLSATRTGITVTEDTPSTATIGTDQIVFVGDNAVFTATSTNADIYQWQVSTDGGVIFNNIADGVAYAGTQTTTLTVKDVETIDNGHLFRILASKSGSSCSAVASTSALLTIQVKTVITNRRITYRVKKN
ncbi:immunoglobulin domain-containing protein [Arenibacter sp. BSSL-BM3]|uniref:Immunoglobulin domain-containing protein n=1 Tax=Arenibacter arenosicollis TaxID=2762274 RepID=A0ABR7QTU3_9FLAO|nr:GEVED domain-containing protein [Arenibacter arenosicollis]MBC8770607.1 immunoglobulin domain-containing protein [Arenibacter arenosicollis]